MGLIGVAVLVLIVFVLMSIKDSEINKKLSRYEQSIENLTQQNHTFRKEIINLTKQKEEFLSQIDDIVEERLKEKIQQSLYPIIESMREIESVMQRFQDEQIERINRIEEKANEKNYIPTSNSSISNEKLIISQYAQGKSEAAIAKDLRIGIGEVDLVLRLANLK